MNGLTPCTEKEGLNKGLVQGQPYSPFECIDEYLADTMEMGSAANDAFSLCPNQENDTTQSLPNGSSRTKNDNEKHDDHGGSKKDMKNMFVPQFTSLDLDEVEVQGNSLHHVELDKQQEDCEGPSMEGASMIFEKADGVLLNDSSLVPASGEQQSLKLFPDSLQVVPGSENHDDLLGEISTESIEVRSQLDLKESGHQHGTRRRCLQFEIVEDHRNADTVRSVSNIVNIFSISSSANPTELKMLDSLPPDSSVLPSDADVAQFLLSPSSNSSLYSLEMPVHDNCDTPIRNSTRTSLKAPKPSGIGLHLNSIVSAAAVCCDAAPGMNSTKSCQTAQREISLSVAKLNLPETPSATSVPSSLTRKNEDYVESTTLVSGSTANTHSPQGWADKVENFKQMSPQKKRKKASYTIESQGCKRCNCKRSKCLKLYCECFAAGIYCAEPCACVECFNKPEYEDTVLETRQQIESRNPLAFAPKVVQRVTGFPAQVVEDGGRATPTSARHKRGCNCKKSKCLKKYCECYQAGVGCSVGCRCDGCKNIYGIKEDYFYLGYEIECKKSDDETWEDPADRKLNITPQTPSLLPSNHGKKFLKSRDLVRQFFPSPESDNNTSSSSSSSTGNPSRTPRTFSSHDKRIKGDNSSLDVCFDQELTCHTTLRVDQFSHNCNELVDLCDLMPLLAPPSSVATSSSVSNTKECSAIAQLQLHGSLRLSGSFRLHDGSVTPIRHLGGSKLLQEPDSHDGYYFTEDDTPEILKDSSTPIKAIKANSPNRKRVSPPHSRFNELRPSSSPGLRSGRKFVLQSIPSFPSLTPYSDSKGGTGK